MATGCSAARCAVGRWPHEPMQRESAGHGETQMQMTLSLWMQPRLSSFCSHASSLARLLKPLPEQLLRLPPPLAARLPRPV